MHDENSPQNPHSSRPDGDPRDFGAAANENGAGKNTSEPTGQPAAPTDLGSQLQSALAESAQTKDALLRALADAENIRRRSAAEVISAHKYAVEDFAANLLAVKDTLEMALADKTSSTEQLRMGVDLTLKNLAAAFDKAKITEVNPLNQKFDPSLHQAVSQVESDQPANTIVQVFQKGYKLQDRVLRAAMVAVAKPKAAQQNNESPVETRGN
jgi:molecular chaperone GrpE